MIIYNKDIMESEYKVQLYATTNGKEPISEWLRSLKDKNSQALIFQRLQRIKLGHFGDCKPLDNGLWEFRIHSGAGYRIYYYRIGKRIILLLCGGDKGGQNKDIKLALKYLEDHRRRANEK